MNIQKTHGDTRVALILSAHKEAQNLLVNNSSDMKKVLCSMLLFYRTYVKFQGKINPLDKQIIQRDYIPLLNAEFIETLAKRKEEVKLAWIEMLGSILRRIPRAIWWNDFPVMRTCVES